MSIAGHSYTEVATQPNEKCTVTLGKLMDFSGFGPCWEHLG